ncbi:DUF5615 family PIN-like protein [Methylobacterium sp. NEAU 140]|uniref:DUF5615 family PIN-like protein n=1 Tax=Methylobacterium sp. NEAU 140 TaxID=3064945 RepID=UPI002735B282|nr:DUF5615 family PIN-like protein [Methylobacterium sp. NEAU 140]MDP4022203.1 DUF5615 family PIN-like protein [Methylobacterium sp. NEAU 140]
MRVIIDMNLSPEWVNYLEDAGYEAVHWSRVGRENDPDEAIMAWATAYDHVVLTGDLDFGEALARTGRARPSVIQIRSRDTRPALIGAAVIDEVRQAEIDLRSGALLTIGSNRTRLKSLPLKT